MVKPKRKERLDILVVERGLADSEEKARALILAGRVRVGGEIALKAGVVVPSEKTIELVPGPKYVSRGGEKLEGALEDFELSPENHVCLDVGSSTGGFTDCLLKRGAAKVFSVDVGKGQLDLSLRQNSKVVSLEETHILHVSPAQFEPIPDFVVIDVSFISLRKILGHVKSLLPGNSTVVAMVKPQFEVEPKFLKKGVVRSDEVRLSAVAGVIEFAKKEGFYYLNQTEARIKGPKGNQEHFILLKTPQ